MDEEDKYKSKYEYKNSKKNIKRKNKQIIDCLPELLRKFAQFLASTTHFEHKRPQDTKPGLK